MPNENVKLRYIAKKRGTKINHPTKHDQDHVIYQVINGSGLTSWDRDNWASPDLERGKISDHLYEKWSDFKAAAYALELELRTHPVGREISERVNEPNSFPN